MLPMAARRRSWSFTSQPDPGIHKRGIPVLVAEQDLQTALERADRGYALEVGHLIMG